MTIGRLAIGSQRAHAALVVKRAGERFGRGEGSWFKSDAESARAGHPVYIVRVSLGVVNGKRLRHKARARSEGEAKAELARLRGLYGPAGDVARLTVDEFLHDWLRGHASTVRASTLRSYTDHVEKYISPLLGGIVVGKLRASDVRRLIAHLLAKRSKRGGSLSPATVGRAVTTLRIALGTAVREGTLASNPASLVRLPKVDRDPVAPMTTERAAAILVAVRRDMFEALYVTLLGSGLRLGEALRLDWRDVDFDASTLAVRQGKTRRSVRTVPVPAWVMTALRAQRARAKRYGLDLPVFMGPRTGERLRPDSCLHHWKVVLEAADLPEMRLHDLRHAHATLLLAAGVPMRTIADQLGHASPSITANVYAHVQPTALREAVSQLDALAPADDTDVGSAIGSQSR